MIHQFIFAGPKPGLSAEAFASYWINFHAVDYAAKIRQIRRYLIAPRIALNTPRPVEFFEGVAEIRLSDDKEQIDSLLSPEFLMGARVDEPRWAAFWRTYVLDTEAEELKTSKGEGVESYFKLYLFLKRRPEMELSRFRDRLLEDRSQRMAGISSLAGHKIGFARAGLYGLGEPRHDAIEVLAFHTLESLAALLSESSFTTDLTRGWSLTDPRYLFTFAGRENWIIRPGER